MDNPSYTRVGGDQIIPTTADETTPTATEETTPTTTEETTPTTTDETTPTTADETNRVLTAVDETEAEVEKQVSHSKVALDGWVNTKTNDAMAFPSNDESMTSHVIQVNGKEAKSSPTNPTEGKYSMTGSNVSSPAADSPMEAEDILCLLGKCGNYQALVFFLVSMVCMRGVWHLFGPIFLGADPGHHCYIPENMTFATNLSLVNDSAPWRQQEADQCRMPVPGEVNSTQPCQYGWVYGDTFSSTFLTQWDFVCDRVYLVDLSSSLFMAGMIIGSLFISPLADKFGRKKILLGALWIQGALGVGAAFVNNYIVFMVIRFFLGALNQTIGLVAYVMVPEAFPSSSRTMPYIALFLFWAFGIMVLALLGYLIRDWTHLELAISIPNFLTLVYYWILPESLPWLMAKQRYKEAEVVIRKAARLNRVTLPPEIMNLSSFHSSMKLIKGDQKKVKTNTEKNQNGPLKTVVPDVDSDNTQTVKPSKFHNHSESEESGKGLTNGAWTDQRGFGGKGLTNGAWTDRNNSGAPVLTNYHTVSDPDVVATPPGGVLTPDVRPPRSYTVIDLFRTPRIRIYSLITFYLWLVNSLSYFGISFSVPTLHGDIFLNLFISGLVEIPAYLICMGTVECLGRRRPLCVFMLVCGCASIIAIFIPTSTGKQCYTVAIFIPKSTGKTVFWLF
ncbi:organic cation/carnitine transporter 2-like isoform X2 [Liolophura sinensis]|uniref:organic cation/carnitine transporter 2-like isoform X2 n=1 Tax=Liolophura sinensis TaxID=3198878 RepID=UPI003158786D